MILTKQDVMRLPARKFESFYWYASILMDLPGESVANLLRQASLPGQSASRNAADRLAKTVADYLTFHKIEGKVCCLNDKHHFFVHHAKHGFDQQVFQQELAGVICEYGSAYQMRIIRALGCDRIWAREYLAFLCALALARCQGPHAKRSKLFVAEYPYLESLDYSSDFARLYGRARLQSVSSMAHSILQQDPYRAVLRKTVLAVIQSAPEGRAHYWAVCIASAIDNVHAMQVAEVLGLGDGVIGLTRARVMVSKIGKKLHTAYFEALCSAALMTSSVAEYMALEYGLPYEVVRRGLAFVGIKNSHAANYAKLNKVTESNSL